MTTLDSERLRLARHEQMQRDERRRQREAGVPDMELWPVHEPLDYFAQVGFFALLDHIGGPTQPDYDWSRDTEDERQQEEARRLYCEARRTDHQRLTDWLRRAKVTPRQHYDGCRIADLRLYWPDRVPRLKTWSGHQSLARLASDRIKALPPDVPDLLTVAAPLQGASGLDRMAAPTSLETGWSANDLLIPTVTRIGAELLAMIGLERLPITIYPDLVMEYTAGGARWRVQREDRDGYYGRWSQATPAPTEDTPCTP